MSQTANNESKGERGEVKQLVVEMKKEVVIEEDKETETDSFCEVS